MAVQVGEQELLERRGLRAHAGTELHQRRHGPHALRIGRSVLAQRGAGGVDHVVHLRAQHAADGLVEQPPPGQAGVFGGGLAPMALHELDLGQVFDAQQARAHAIVDVVGVVGDLVGQVAQLRLQAGLAAVQEAVGDAARLLRLQPLRIGPRAVLEDALARLEAQVQAVELRVAVLQRIDDAQALQVVLEAAMRGHAVVQRVLSGVAEGRVAQVVRQRDRLDQVLVQAQRPGDRTGELRHFERVREPRTEQVALVVQEDLRLVDQPTEGRGMDDAVAVALKVVAGGRGRLRVPTSARQGRLAGPGRWRGDVGKQRRIGHRIRLQRPSRLREQLSIW